MKKQVSFFDIVRFFICFLIAFLIYVEVEEWGFSISPITPESFIGVLLPTFYGTALPAFLSILLGLIIISFRYKLVAGVLLLYLVIAFRIQDILGSFNHWTLFLPSIIRLSFGLLGATGAIFVWQILPFSKNKNPKPQQISRKIHKPKTSILLLLLSLFSVPLTHLGMFVSAFVTLGLSAVLLMLIMQTPRVPILLIVATVIVLLVAIRATFKSLWVMFFPQLDFHPAIPLDYSQCPRLKNLVNKVCQRLKTKLPDTIILHAEPIFFVLQGKLNTFNGVVKGRILALGIPLFRELNSSEMQSILAHELAYFSGKDTFYSSIVSPVYRGIFSSMNNLEGATREGSKARSSANAMNMLLFTSRLFLGIFLRYFLTIDMILSRSRKLRADWIASSLFGKETFGSALTKTIVIWRFFSENYEKIALENEKEFFDKHSQLLQLNHSKLEEYKNRALSEKEGELDSHLSLSTRLNNLPVSVVRSEIDILREVYDLELELLEKEKELSQRYTNRIKNIVEKEEMRRKRCR